MSLANLRVTAMGGTQIAVGLSAITRVVPGPYQTAHTMKIVGGSGTLWVSPLVPTALTGTSCAASIAVGYPLGSSEVYSAGGPATFYLSAAAATMTVGILFGYDSGVSLL